MAGFYRENYRHGRGSMFYGHVKDEIASDGVHVLKFDCRMDCLWLAGYMRAGGLNHYAKSGEPLRPIQQDVSGGKIEEH
jgi:hypothetical protein